MGLEQAGTKLTHSVEHKRDCPRELRTKERSWGTPKLFEAPKLSPLKEKHGQGSRKNENRGVSDRDKEAR
jgi:hypothetical protein